MFNQAVATAFSRLLHPPSAPSRPRPVAKSGSAAGSGTSETGAKVASKETMERSMVLGHMCGAARDVSFGSKADIRAGRRGRHPESAERGSNANRRFLTPNGSQFAK